MLPLALGGAAADLGDLVFEAIGHIDAGAMLGTRHWILDRLALHLEKARNDTRPLRASTSTSN